MDAFRNAFIKVLRENINKLIHTPLQPTRDANKLDPRVEARGSLPPQPPQKSYIILILIYYITKIICPTQMTNQLYFILLLY